MNPERLRLYYPVNPFVVNQNFGENKPCVRDFGTSAQEVINPNPDGTCPVGSDKLYQHWGMSGHNGTDLQAGEQEVRAACAGTIIEKQVVPARGLGLGILTDNEVLLDGIGPSFVKLRYWHLKNFAPLLEVGDHVKEGDLLGISDNTGYSSANHLHFEGDPMHKDAGGHPILTYANGTFGGTQVIAGAIDMAPYFTGTYAEDVQHDVAVLQQVIQLITGFLAQYKKV